MIQQIKHLNLEQQIGLNNANKKVTFKNFDPLTDCITEINNAQVDNAQKIDAVMPIYNLTECSDAIQMH